MKRNKHLLLWSSAGVLILLFVAAGQENFAKEWRHLQGRVAADSTDGFNVQLRQIVVPQLRITDRCITCHVGMAAGETGISGDKVLGAHPNVVHDVAEYGCTTCHGGQGRATEKDDAHGTVHHWPEPMIPARYAEAGCGSCHTHIEVPNYDTLKRGAKLVERFDCLACHALEGRGGTLRPGGAAGVTSPDLSIVGMTGYRGDWYAHHLREHRAGDDSAWATSFGEIAPDELEAIESLLASRVGAPRLVEAKALFHSSGCRGCHKIGGVGGDDGPDLTLAGQRDPGLTDFSHVPEGRSLAGWFAEHFRAPSTVVPGSLMPALGLTEDEIDLLTLYMFSLRRSDVPEAYWPKDRIRATRFDESEFSRDPATLFGTFCAACHGPAGEGMRYAGMAAFPAIGSRGFLELASDEFIVETIQRGRPGRRMPAWGGAGSTLTGDEVRELVAHLRTLGGGVEASPAQSIDLSGVDAVSGASLYGAHCASCHGKTGEGAEGPALSNKVFVETASDWYIAETVLRGRPGTSMEGFATPSTTRPTLTRDDAISIVAHIRSWEEKR